MGAMLQTSGVTRGTTGCSGSQAQPASPSRLGKFDAEAKRGSSLERGVSWSLLELEIWRRRWWRPRSFAMTACMQLRYLIKLGLQQISHMTLCKLSIMHVVRYQDPSVNNKARGMTRQQQRSRRKTSTAEEEPPPCRTITATFNLNHPQS